MMVLAEVGFSYFNGAEGDLMNGKGALERAFELADAGWSLLGIRAALQREGYDPAQLHGQTVTAALSKRIRAANAKKPVRVRVRPRSKEAET
jgi:hypothetical protein